MPDLRDGVMGFVCALLIFLPLPLGEGWGKGSRRRGSSSLSIRRPRKCRIRLLAGPGTAGVRLCVPPRSRFP